jgi:hypothetical protein
MCYKIERYEITPFAESREIFIKQFYLSVEFPLVTDNLYTFRLPAS